MPLPKYVEESSEDESDFEVSASELASVGNPIITKRAPRKSSIAARAKIAKELAAEEKKKKNVGRGKPSTAPRKDKLRRRSKAAVKQ